MTTPSDILTPAPAATQVLCDHCGQVVPPGLVEAGAEHQFCCGGCRAVYETIHACNLAGYYRLRQATGGASPASVSGEAFESFDTPAFAELYVRPINDDLVSTDLMLEGVSCAACVWLIERLPRILDGVVEARLSLRQATVRLTWEPGRVRLSQIARLLDSLGYTPHPAKGLARRELQKKEERKRLVRLGVAGAIMGNTMLLGLALYAGAFGGIEDQYRVLFRWVSAFLGTIALAWPGATFFRSALAALRLRSVNLDVPIALALLAGGLAGLVNTLANRGEIYFDSLTVLIFLLLVGRWMQYRQQRRADDAVELLFSLTPSSCRIVRGEQVVEMPIEALGAGDLVEVRPGELIPADGAVESGQSSVNQALLTGESLPAAVGVGDRVYASSLNVASVLRIRVDCVGEQTRVGRLMELVERGVAQKPAIVQFTDRVGFWFVLIVCLAAAGTFAFWASYSVSDAIDHAVALLIVTCPCVLGLATPLTLAVALGRLARRNILVKSGSALERLARGGRLLLDKTGTLTEGRLRLLAWYGEERLRPVVAAIERHSTHPVALALQESAELRVLSPEYSGPTVRKRAGERTSDQPESLAGPFADPTQPAIENRKSKIENSLDPSTIVERGDGGISARVGDHTIRIGSPRYMDRQSVRVPEELQEVVGGIEDQAMTAVLVAVDQTAVAVAALGDQVREEAAQDIARLRALGFVPQILSGDAAAVVRAVAGRLGIEAARAQGQVLPEEKLQRVREGPGPTVMVGDGVNDAAALAAADVGVAVHGSAEASLAAADVYIARPGLGALVELAQTSRQALRTIRRNLLVSLAYNLLAGTLAMTGLMSPLLAAILMPLSSATVLSLAVASLSARKRGDGCP